jgi:hypothetical protein
MMFAKRSLILITLIFAEAGYQNVQAEDQWFCREGASRLLGDVMESCGIGKSPDEGTARKNALDGAFEEFDRICRESANCRDYEKTVVPMRTECIQGKDQAFTCYRALDFTVTTQKKEKAFDDKDKKDAVVAAIAANTDPTDDPNSATASKASNAANPALAQTTGTPDPDTDDQPVVYRNVRYTVYNPYVYVIGSQPQVVYVRSQLPPQYVPPQAAPPPPPSMPTKRMNGRKHPGNRHPKKFHSQQRNWKRNKFN